MDLSSVSFDIDGTRVLPSIIEIKGKGFSKIYETVDISVEKAPILELSMEDFFDYCISHNIKELFVHKQPINVDKYYITEECLERYKKNIYDYDKSLDTFFELWNYQIFESRTELEHMCGTMVFFVKENTPFIITSILTYNPIEEFVKECMPEFEDISITGSHIIEIFAYSLVDKYKEHIEQQKAEILELVTELKRYILDDTEFYASTNKTLRDNYSRRLLNSTMFKEIYKQYLSDMDSISNVYRMVQNLYNLYKIEVKLDNKKLGEKLSEKGINDVISKEHTFDEYYSML